MRSNQKALARYGGVPKLCGADAELCNFILGGDDGRESGGEAARAVLREIDGVSAEQAVRSAAGSGCAANAQDEGRKFIAANGGCAYIDLQHLELCVPEVVSAFDFVAAWHAMIRIAQEAQERANALLPKGRRIVLIANNSDGQGHSYGSHVNFLVARRCWDNIFHRRLQDLLTFASFLASSIVLTGAGKAGSENGRRPAAYQISQRADFLETLTGSQTTYARPIVNSRDESHCGRFLRDGDDRDHELARMHVIFFDNTLSHTATLLKIGTTQLVLAMIEQGEAPPDLILEDPLQSVHEWSRALDFGAPQATLAGRRYTAVELQVELAARARRFVAAGRAAAVVPRAGEIVDLWEATLKELDRRDWDALAPKLDWVLKKTLIESAVRRRGLDWDAPEIKILDHMYASLDARDGLYWAMEAAGRTRPVAGRADIDRLVSGAPDDTRAWLRSFVLRAIDPRVIVSANWDHVRLRLLAGSPQGWRFFTYHTLPMPDPLGCTRSICEPILSQAGSAIEGLQALGMYSTDRNGVFHAPAAGN